METVFRRASRVVVLDPRDRILLVQYVRPSGARYWATPGGGLLEDETHEAAARRELAEELGIVAERLEPLWTGPSTYVHGGRQVVQEEKFYLCRLPSAELPPDHDGVRMQEGIVDLRWWSASELASPPEPYFPENLREELIKLQRS